MTDKDGGPAFPADFDYQSGLYTGTTGMTLRDWFAGQALVAHLGNPKVKHSKFDETWSATYCATIAYQIADAMLSQRSKETS